MSRYSRYETFSDGEHVYDDRHDGGEFDTFGGYSSRNRGPSSGAFYDGHTRNARSNRSPYDRDGYPREGSYAGEEPLRHRLGRESYGAASYNERDPRTHPGQDDRSRSGYATGQRSRLSQATSAEYGREERRQARREQQEYERQLQAEYEREQQGRGSRSAGSFSPDPYARSGRRGAVTSANDPYLEYAEAVRAQQQAQYDGGYGGSRRGCR